ncbi:GNAT family N-acetyltransferase [Roseisolibacter sp. H3M3-2]|uniref:GNAT family N-acetyltransferase n=1 Tax=Roseisolibacter sp. H3M3-2 TaxID=3031323 RepID=UPI0023DB0A39|nr:GNAT family N-acetyltransferase [Roseisolibacter sp. H3M3-2]MDF1501353.1 GNAT family N-acetyltransferase [Roseisolibacter sp. H3M3-2]
MPGLRLSRSTAAFEIDQRADGTHELRVPHERGSIVVRPTAPGESLLPVYRLNYDIFVNERGMVAAEALPAEMQRTQAKWDRWDEQPTTHHFVAEHEGRVIGHMRVIDDSAAGLPTEAFGFDLGEHREAQPLREISKLMIAKGYRGGGIMAAFYWHVFQTCHVQDGIPAVYLSCERALAALYGRIGAVELGQFVHRETRSMFAAMRVAFCGDYERQFELGARALRAGARAAIPSAA